jgi:hypothetical protein
MSFSLAITTAAEKNAASRVALLEDLARIRWENEVGGVTLPDGTTLPTDQQTRVSLTGAVNSLANGMMTAPVAWKFPGGWADLTQAQIEAAAAAVVTHVQACFSAERAVQTQVEALADLTGFDHQTAFTAALNASQ